MSLAPFSVLSTLSFSPLLAFGAPALGSYRSPLRFRTNGDGTTLGSVVDDTVGSGENSTTKPTESSISFAADASIDVKLIYDAVKAAKSKSIIEYQKGIDDPEMIPIYGDWLELLDTPVVHFIGDMDVDCDGVDHACKGGSSGDPETASQPQTSWGHLSATKVPFYVLPMEFKVPAPVNGPPKPNALGAIICGGKMFYAIFGDQNGNQPQLIGEASIMLAQACFPDDGLSGAVGHTDVDVAYIVFPEQVPDGIDPKDAVEIDISKLKEIGDKNIKKLQTRLQEDGAGSGSSTASGSLPSGETPTTSAAESSETSNPDKEPTSTLEADAVAVAGDKEEGKEDIVF